MKMILVIGAVSAALTSGCVMRVPSQGGNAYGPPRPYAERDYYNERGGYRESGNAYREQGGRRESGSSRTSLRESEGGRPNCTGNLAVSVSDGKTPREDVTKVMDYVSALLCDNPTDMVPQKPSTIDVKVGWKPESSGSIKTSNGTTISWRPK